MPIPIMKMLLPLQRCLLIRHVANTGRTKQQPKHQHFSRVASAARAASCLVAATALSLPVAANCDYNSAAHDHDDHENDEINPATRDSLSVQPNQLMRNATIFASSPLPSGKKLMDHSSNPITAQPQTTVKTLFYNDDDDDETQKQIIVCDYAIIGHGKAGRSAVRTIQRLDPTATIVIIDPNNFIIDNNNKSNNNNIYTPTRAKRKSTSSCKSLHHLQSRANSIDHAHKLIHVHSPMNRMMMLFHQKKSNNISSSLSSASNEAVNSHKSTIVHYRRSALLATGSRGAPPPEGCVRDDARSRILELRSTTTTMALPAVVRRSSQYPPSSSSSFSSLATTGTTSMHQLTTTTSSLPILHPLTVRSLSSMAASQGATIAIMGSGFEALELAAHCARMAASSSASSISKVAQTSLQHHPQREQQQVEENNHSNDVSRNKVKLLFGNSSPMSNRLPRYLGVAVTKRLRQNGIDVEDRTMTRYVAMNHPMDSSSPSFGSDHDNGGAAESVNSNSSVGVHHRHRHPPQLEIYTVKSYDHMDTKRMHADLLVLAPSVDGLNGTAVMPTRSYGSIGNMHTTSATTIINTDYLPWSSLISPPLLTCYLDDGRVVTNAELNAASSLYAAGSVARYPNRRTGRAEISGGRHVSAEHAGEVAARNMVAACSGSSWTGETAPCYMEESIPVWRSDRIPCLPLLSSHGEGEEEDDQVAGRHYPTSSSSSLALYSIGIHALCVGRCDSECMATHGFWWTNQSTIHSGQLGAGRDDVIGKSTFAPNAFMRRATRRMTNSSSSNAKSSRGSLPVYGSGVVFYLDRSGNVEGILLWGLPYTANPRDTQSTLNFELVERLKDMIRSNGGVSVTDHSESISRNHPGMNLDVSLLSYLHLAEESKHLATLALKGTSPEGKIGPRVVLGRPLHRYTPIKPMELTNVGKMHRKDEAGHATEEDDVFYSSMTSSTEDEAVHQRMVESGRPPSLKRIYPMRDMTSEKRFSVGATERERKTMQLERSRPPKEEPLWMRHGDEHRFVSKRDVLVDSFLRNITSGRFSDGSDAIKQAPVPKIYLDVKEKWSAWKAGEKDETEDD